MVVLRILCSQRCHRRAARAAAARVAAARCDDVCVLAHERRDGRDFFGNRTTWVAWHEPVEQIEFRLTARAERFPPFWSQPILPTHWLSRRAALASN